MSLSHEEFVVAEEKEMMGAWKEYTRRNGRRYNAKRDRNMESNRWLSGRRSEEKEGKMDGIKSLRSRKTEGDERGRREKGEVDGERSGRVPHCLLTFTRGTKDQLRGREWIKGRDQKTSFTLIASFSIACISRIRDVVSTSFGI